MTEIVLFGGTSEGRELAELFARKRLNSLVCVATEYGESLLRESENVRMRSGRLDAAGIAALLAQERPRIVIDATHPYATEVSANIAAACVGTDVRLIRLVRESGSAVGCERFADLPALIAWLNLRDDVIFSTLGAKEASALTAVRGYRERVWLRVLPDATGLSVCVSAGFDQARIICMQGPFTRELNAAMFRRSGAAILLTKDTGTAGGFREKLDAAAECGMSVALLTRPREESGFTLSELIKLIGEGAL